MWAITCYFNPAGYRRRLEAYRVFRAGLTVPLLAVELAYGGRSELQASDADLLLQMPGRDVLWQKERLLNLAIRALPPECEEVAWLDCDVLFARQDWHERASSMLLARPLVQLFQRVHYLGPEWKAGEPPAAAVRRTRPSIASGIAAGMPVRDCLSHPSRAERPGTYANGLAWAARRRLLEGRGLFDASIIGGGDRAISAAAFGCFEHVFDWHHLNERQRAYYLRWAEPFFASCGGEVGVLDDEIHHVWHGSAADRGLRWRHRALSRFGFDPFTDIAVDEHGSWRWSSDKPELHAYVRDYFTSRREDG